MRKKFRPYLMFTPPFLAIFNILTFTVFPIEGAAKVIVCLICYVGAQFLVFVPVCIRASFVDGHVSFGSLMGNVELV